VENYSLFVFSVTVYSLTGLFVVSGKINRWFILPPLGLAIFFHVLGVTLIPSALYVLLINSRLTNAINRLSFKTKLLPGVFVATIAAIVFYHYYSTDYFFRFAIVPLFKDRFAIEGYTLFSLKHVVDSLNLLILLLPGLPIVAVSLLFLPVRTIFQQREYRYLLILLALTLGAVFIFDPKLGMSRDWDLFSFSGVPLAMWCYYLVLDKGNRIAGFSMISALAITLGFLLLVPRAFSQIIPEASLAHFESYIRFDEERNRNSRVLLVNYYENIGDSVKAQFELRRWKTDHPEEVLVSRCNELYFKEKRLDETIYLLRKALDLNPVYSDAYSFLGVCYLDLKKYDSALMLIKIANGLRPNHPPTVNNLGMAYASNGDYKRAEKALLQAIRLDSTMLGTLYNLARLYQSLNKMEKYHYYLNKLACRADAPMEAIGELGDYYLGQGEYEKAGEAYYRALQKGLDSLYVKGLIEKYPQLKDWLH
jgi:tetratricopeptide (TPR) repeat protein